MKSRWIVLVVFVVLLVAATLQMAYYYPRLPERMASHFDLQGRADGWSPKGTFFGIMAGILYGMSGLLLLVGLLTRWLPASMVNLPHKDIWLAPPEAQRTRDFLANGMLWFANATIVLMMGMNHATFRGNLAARPGGDPAFFIWAGLYLAFTLAWCLRLWWRFRRPPL